MLSDQQRRLLEFLAEYQAAHGFLPSVREVMKCLGVRSTNTAQYHLNKMKAGGYLRRVKGRARAYSLTDRARNALGQLGQVVGDAVSRSAGAIDSIRGRTIPLVGRITAGDLDLAVEDAANQPDVADFLGADESTFALRVEGDSMQDAGIYDGDLVVVHRQSHLRDGEIGVVLVDGETTVKTIRFEAEEMILSPANPSYCDIRIPRSHPNLEVCGRVIGIVRRI